MKVCKHEPKTVHTLGRGYILYFKCKKCKKMIKLNNWKLSPKDAG